MRARRSSTVAVVLSIVIPVFPLSVLVYFLPSIVAWNRQVRNFGSVLAINLFLGWTLVGWVVALAMAMRYTD